MIISSFFEPLEWGLIKILQKKQMKIINSLKHNRIVELRGIILPEVNYFFFLTESSTKNVPIYYFLNPNIIVLNEQINMY